MALKLKNGDYYKEDGNGEPATVDYIEELLQNALVALNTARGSFYPNKSFGSRIRRGVDAPESEYAFAFACQALDKLDGVFVKSASADNRNANIKLIVNGSEKEVSISLNDNL